MNSNVITFLCTRKPTTPEEIRAIEERIADPYTLTGKDKLRAFYEMKGLKFDEEKFENIVEESLEEYALMNSSI